MKLRGGKTYTVPNSSIKMYVIAVRHISDKGYIKFKGILSSLSGYVFETKNYKIDKKHINRWIETQ